MKICKFYKTWFFWFFMPIIIGIILPALNVWRVDVSLQWKHPFHPDGWYFGYNERRQKTNYLAEHATQKIDTIFLNFSDPWPKKRHAKRRLTHEYYLGIYDELFSNKNCKKIIMKTDNDDLFEFSLESFKKYGYDIKEISYDLHSENIFNIMTEYEKKFSKKGIAIKYVKAVKIKKEE